MIQNFCYFGQGDGQDYFGDLNYGYNQDDGYCYLMVDGCCYCDLVVVGDGCYYLGCC